MSKVHQRQTRANDAVLGAAVADAASLGLHWLYDQQHIRKLEPKAPEYHQHVAQDYADVAGYYAHERRQRGESSQYGEQMKALLRSLSECSGQYDKSHHELCFKEAFGYGGTYIGYIDHPTKEALDNLARAEHHALERAYALPFNRDDALKRKLVTKVLGCLKQADGEALKKKVEATVRRSDNDDYLVDHAQRIADEMASVNGYHGGDDRQLPALSCIPAILAFYYSEKNLPEIIESAVRVTHNNDDAVAFAQASAKLLATAINTGDIKRVIACANEIEEKPTVALINDALSSLSSTTTDMTRQWGMACELKLGFPSIVHNLATSNSYAHGVRQNIYSGGDSCGRSIVLGAVLAACFGVDGDRGIPESWLSKLADRQWYFNHLLS